jgi:hypothetical protein
MAMATHAYITDKTELQRLRGIRKDIEASLERMIAVLDEMDGDPDLPSGDENEPTMGCGNNGRTSPFCMAPSGDGELEESDEENAQLGWANEGRQTWLHGRSDEYEPSLGAPEAFPMLSSMWGHVVDHRSSQVHWGQGSTRDGEDDDADLEPDADDAEPRHVGMFEGGHSL